MVSTSWNSAPLPEWIIQAMALMGFDTMTPVQAHAIPRLAGNQDLVVEAETGSGKTLSFILPALVRLSKLSPVSSGHTNVIIVSPTRELAQQTHRVLESVLQLAPEDMPKVRSQLMVGGNISTTTADHSTFMSRKPHVVIATPGRLLQLLTAKHVKTSSVDLLILDEADRLLDIDSMATLNKIFAALPKQKRVGLFSATMSDALEDIIRVGMRNPVKITVSNKSATPRALALHYSIVSYAEKMPAAINALKNTNYSRAIVYLPTCTSVTYWYQVLSLFLSDLCDVKLFSLHGKLPQATRVKTLSAFTACHSRCALITTDVAARGLDIDDVDFVLQIDPPIDPNVFVHRAGRCARAGRPGLCLVLLNDDLEQNYVEFMAVRKVRLDEHEPVSAEDDVTPKQYETKVHEFLRKDRSRHDLALRSFLSCVRAYSKHTATSIFRLSVLDLKSVAASFGIFRMPRMPELKGKTDDSDGWLVEPFDWNDYKYQDAAQEKARLARLKEAPLSKTQIEENKRNKQRNAVAWSDKTERKTEATRRREKRFKKALKKKEAYIAEHAAGAGAGAVSDDESNVQDWKELVRARKKHKPATSGVVFDL